MRLTRSQRAALHLHPLLLVGILAALLASFWGIGYRPVAPQQFRRPAGITVPEFPVQGQPQITQAWEKYGQRIRPLASFHIRGRVLMNIPYSERSSPSEEMRRHFQLSPLDLVLTWGKLSDTQELKKFSFSHGYRFVYLKPKTRDVMPDAGSHLSHIHAIPATDGIRELLESFGQEDIITLTGHLVSVESSGNPWTSSLSRNDDGDGACEIMWIDHAQLESERPGLFEFWIRRFEERFG